MRGYGAFDAKRDTPLFIQFSGGRTSGFMAAMAPEEVTITFQNTGREDEKTLEFVQRTSDAIKREVTWLEFRPPAKLGARPRDFQFEVVNFDTAARKGEPFAEFMKAINAYRIVKGKGLISPWPKSRICTVHLKHRVLDHYLASLGITAHDRWIGLRADEEHRVAGLRRQETLTKGLYAPLYEAGVDKAMVMDFWSRQSFDLGLPEHRGNCDGCFLKDQADVSRALGGRPEDIAWWAEQQRLYPNFGGVTFHGYEALAHELPTRLAIEAAYQGGSLPVNDGRLDAKRFKLVLIQERKRFEHGPAQFSCACESGVDEDEEDDEDALAA